MTINNFKTLADIINHTVFFDFINKKDEELTYNYIFNELFGIYCSQNPLALAEPGCLIPLSRRRLIKHLEKSKKSGLRIPKKNINLKKRLRIKIREILKKPYTSPPAQIEQSGGIDDNETTTQINLELEEIRKEYLKREDELNKLPENKIYQVDGFSSFANSISISSSSINSLSSLSLLYLGESRRKFRTEHLFNNSDPGLSFLSEIKGTRDRFRSIIKSINTNFHNNPCKVDAPIESENEWNTFFAKDDFNESPLYIDLKNILKNLNNISQRDSQIYKRVKVCKFHEICNRPFFYAIDTSQTTCASKKCQKRNRKSK